MANCNDGLKTFVVFMTSIVENDLKLKTKNHAKIPFI